MGIASVEGRGLGASTVDNGTEGGMTLDRNTLLEAAKVCESHFAPVTTTASWPVGISSSDIDGHWGQRYAAILRALAAAQPEGVVVPLEPTKKMIEAGAQRLVRWETGKEKWPDAWSALDVSAARNDAERCWRSMWLSAAGGKS